MKKIKVMIVDDNDFMREMIATILEQEDMEIVAELENGLNIISEINAKEPDVVLLDVIMPEMNGLGVLEHIHENKFEIDTMPKFMIVSANGQKGFKERAFELGVCEYVIKPFDSKEMVKKIREACF